MPDRIQTERKRGDTMSVMTKQEQQLVEEHLYLVKNIVLSTMSINETVQGLGYDDLYQTGCEALCYAAMRYQVDRGASFVTFADVVIKNKLISHCRKINRIQAPVLYLDTPLADGSELTFADTLQDENDYSLSNTETFYMLSEAEKNLSGISQKGIDALKLKLMGHTGVEIARYYGVKPNHIAAWISRAISKLRTDCNLTCLQH